MKRIDDGPHGPIQVLLSGISSGLEGAEGCRIP